MCNDAQLDTRKMIMEQESNSLSLKNNKKRKKDKKKNNGVCLINNKKREEEMEKLENLIDVVKEIIHNAMKTYRKRSRKGVPVHQLLKMEEHRSFLRV